MNTWEAITGIIILGIGLILFYQSYNNSVQCNSIGGQISTAISSLFGSNSAQACYDQAVIEVGSIITAIIGGLIVYSATKNKSKR